MTIAIAVTLAVGRGTKSWIKNYCTTSSGHVPDGIWVGCMFEKLLDGKWQDNDNGNRTVVERIYTVYQIVPYGEGWLLTQNDAETFCKGMEEYLKKFVDGGSMNR